MKFKKIILKGLLIISLAGAILPVFSNTIVNAQSTVKVIRSNVEHVVETYNYKYLSQLPKEKANTYKKALLTILNGRILSKDSMYKVIHNIDKLAAKENNILIVESRSSFWDGQGITVDEFGATVDTALILLSGGGATGVKVAINALISRYGYSGAINLIVSKLAQLGLGAFVSQLRQALPWIIGLTSPGKGIARYIDSIDFYPSTSNGRINFWP